MIKKLCFLLLLVQWPLAAQQQQGTFAIDPPAFSENEEITITVSGVDPSVWGVSDVYLWAWYFKGNSTNATDSPTNGTWQDSDETQKMTANADGTFSYTLTPTAFYNDTDIGRMGMLVKAKDGTGDNKTQDHLVDVGTYQLALTAPSEPLTVLDAGTSLTVTATTTEAATFVLSANGTDIDSGTVPGTDYSFTVTNILESTDFELQATSNGETLTETFSVVVRPTVTEAPLPSGVQDGINLDAADPSTATLVLYAPGKEFVHLIGDMNDWSVQDDYLMNRDPATDRFWITLTDLVPRTNYGYQYLVDLDINVADPYSTTILDPFNDGFIDAETYPDLPAYPVGKTTQAVTLLRTGDPAFNWSAETLNFKKPDRDKLVIYELLIRDFDERHSFDAVRERLDYLEGLGVNAIELMPVNEFDGNESWGYNPAFHNALDKYYGTPEAFKTLIDECHKRGMAVILDVVYNHASGQHPYYRLWNTDNGGTGGQAAPDNPFFNPAPRHAYNVFNDFNHQSAATRAYVEQTLAHWITEYRVDGFRWDLTKGFTQNCTASDEGCTNTLQQDRIEVLKQYADVQWALDPDFYVIFEHLGVIAEEKEWADYRLDEGKGIMFWNKLTDPYNETTMGYHVGGQSDFSNVSYQVKGFDNPAAISYMESHDEERIMYKNLEFGNVQGSYSVKDLDTALERVAAAGAFLFLVPGPTMLWQFGELGYEVPIDFNGRTGNKPIRWEYLQDPDRKAIYDTWAKLIDLKKEAPIFTTVEFELDARAANGVKKLHLSHSGADADGISAVTVIGNFGMTTTSVDPEFQETGTWYNLMERNSPLEVSSPNMPMTLQPGEFRVFGNRPFVEADDLDSDGVPNAEDQCPDTPLGATVDVSGCTVFTLPSSNYTVSSESIACRGQESGSIHISFEAPLTYLLTASGPNGFERSETINTSEFSLTDLAAGAYSLCFSVDGETDYEQCFDMQLAQPEDLSVFSQLDTNNQELLLTLSGSKHYVVTLNGMAQQTQNESLKLSLQPGTNTVTVSTGLDCQGSFTETYFISSETHFYPNPVGNELSLYIGGNDAQVDLVMYNMAGSVVATQGYKVPPNRKIELPMAQYSRGQYLIKLVGPTTNKVLKVMKQ
ncbi:alpha-amylase family glycosyl hydrolase [Maribacter sp. 2307ULW6-5]|uniref:alpha-amylase family glycosyl hydrolase n=1 Tax=Maribacter sp. 2307ULW6-5 TaxID=3386275 RepID=UPI0039BD7105